MQHLLHVEHAAPSGQSGCPERVPGSQKVQGSASKSAQKSAGKSAYLVGNGVGLDLGDGGVGHALRVRVKHAGTRSVTLGMACVPTRGITESHVGSHMDHTEEAGQGGRGTRSSIGQC